MTTWYKWIVQCSTDSNWYETYTESETEPTVCPNNAAHSVVTNSGRIIKKLSTATPILTAPEEDGRLMVSPGLFPDYMNPYFTSEGDDFANGVRGGGTRLVLSHANGADEETITEFRFVDYMQILGGYVRVSSANKEDYLSIDCIAPATAVVSNGSNLGNCNLVDIGGGAHVIIPAGGDGTHDVDITSPANANLAGDPGQPILVTAAVPVPSENDDGTPTGYWDWDRTTGALTPNYTGEGRFNLYDFQIVLSRYVWKMCIYNGNSTYFEHDLSLTHRGGPFLPHWICRLYTTRASTHSVLDPAVFYNFTVTIARKLSY